MIEERALVTRVINGDMYAFRLLIKQHERLVAHMVGRLIKSEEEKEELAQDVFLKVYDKLKDFNFQSKLSTWIATIAYRLAINHLRKEKMVFSEIPEEERFTKRFIEEETPADLLVEADTDQFVSKLVEQLPEQYKVILNLYHVEHMTYPEICQIMNLPEGTVKSYLFRARNLLKEVVQKHSRKEELL
jgi:RNA polymerase sigma factor (sigma-70 family)